MDKKPKLIGQEAEDLVFQYLAKQNRPYNVQNVFDNLHGSVGKALVVTILDKLASEGRIIAKEFGKAKAYLIAQTHTVNISPTELEAENAENAKLRKELEERHEELAKKTSECGNSLRIPILFQDTRDKNLQLEAKIAHAHEVVAASCLSQEVCQEVTARYAEKEGVVKKRRRLCLDILGRMTDGSDMTMTQAYQYFGISVE